MEDRYSRRSFCVRLVVAAAGVALVRPGGTPAKAADDWIVIGPVSKFSHKAVTPTNLPKGAGGGPAFVVRGDGGQYTVFSGRCTHRGCPLSWSDGAKLFICPCHGGKFDQTGKVVSGPPQTPLGAIPSRVTPDGQLSVKAS